MSVKLEGLDQLNRAIAEMRRRTDGEIAGRVALEGAALIRDEYRQTAPLGPTGKLRKSAQAFRGRKASRFGAFAIAWLKFRVAPEATLVEFGTHERFPGRKRALKIPLNRLLAITRGINAFLFTKHVAAVEPNPVFEKAVNAKTAEVLDHMLRREKELIEGVGK